MAWQTFAHDADVGVRGSGASQAEAFAEAAMALTSAVCDPHRVRAREPVAVACAAPDDEMLLVDWLNALVFEMATRGMLFSRFDVSIADGHLAATAWGEAVDVARHQPAAEVKAVTYCELAVGRDADGQWFAQCVIDV